MSLPKTLSRAKATVSLPIPVEFNSLLLCHITTSTGFNVCFVGETGGLERDKLEICWLEGKRLTQCGGWGGKLFSDVLAMGRCWRKEKAVDSLVLAG